MGGRGETWGAFLGVTLLLWARNTGATRSRTGSGARAETRGGAKAGTERSESRAEARGGAKCGATAGGGITENVTSERKPITGAIQSRTGHGAEQKGKRDAPTEARSGAAWAAITGDAATTRAASPERRSGGTRAAQRRGFPCGAECHGRRGLREPFGRGRTYENKPRILNSSQA